MNTLRLTAPLELVAADAAGDAPGRPRFELVAYTGAAIRQAWSRQPLVVDLAGLEAGDAVPILYGHDASLDAILGQSSSVSNNGETLTLSGELFGAGPVAERVLALAAAGLRFQASIGADTGPLESVPAGSSATVNGRDFAGPISIVRTSRLREVSVVLFGADANTSAAIAAGDAAETLEETPMADIANETPVEPTEASAIVAAEAPTPTNQELPTMADLKAELIAAAKAEILADVRAARPAAPAIHVVQPVDGPAVVEASLCLAGGLAKPDAHFDERTLEAAHRRARVTSLGSVLVAAARANGYDGPERLGSGNLAQVLRAAFATHQIANIVSATYGKFLLNGYNAVEATWNMIANVRSVSDFKTVTGVRLGGGFVFEEVSPGGELKSADAVDEARTIRARTYGRISSIRREDLVNDDLSALTQVPQRLGRGAALALNSAFWAEFESSNASFYQKATAAAGNALALSSLKDAVTAYKKLKDPDGNPLGISPAMILVPPALELSAAELMSSSLLISGEAATRGNANVLAGRFQVVGSSYLSSDSTWWLVANPADLPAMEVAFLNGQTTPTVEQADADFNVLGIQVRGYHDWGVAKAESRACYRMATA
jgi:phage major head subunit gpT-like protein